MVPRTASGCGATVTVSHSFAPCRVIALRCTWNQCNICRLAVTVRRLITCIITRLAICHTKLVAKGWGIGKILYSNGNKKALNRKYWNSICLVLRVGIVCRLQSRVVVRSFIAWTVFFSLPLSLSLSAYGFWVSGNSWRTEMVTLN